MVVFGLLVVSYCLASALITPRMRFLTKQQFLYNQRVNGLLVESTKSIRDVHLHGSNSFLSLASMTSARKASAMTGC